MSLDDLPERLAKKYPKPKLDGSKVASDNKSLDEKAWFLRVRAQGRGDEGGDAGGYRRAGTRDADSMAPSHLG